jgi:hypothetical protein
MARQTRRSTLKTRWQAYVKASFPEGLAGEEVADVEVTSLHAYTAGCIDTFIRRGGRLDKWKTAVLGLCYRDLAVVVLGLKGERRDYFGRLEQMAGIVLAAVRDHAEPAGAR